MISITPMNDKDKRTVVQLIRDTMLKVDETDHESAQFSDAFLSRALSGIAK